ncbi:MAG: ParA family protein [Alphaproteobacteria bacterium]
MLTISVSNIKGGSGKTTVATSLAAWCAARGLRTGLADLDRQRGALSWLARRSKDMPPIRGIDMTDGMEDAPRKLDVLVVDGVAAMRGKVTRDVVEESDCLLIPILPSILDEDGTRRFLDQIAKLKPIRKGRRRVGFVANRLRPRTHAAVRLDAFLASQPYPTVARLRESSLYAAAAVSGLGIGEIAGRRAASFREEWMPILEFALPAE